ncbi:MAG: hypothetical protein JXB07_19505 [Anaerolineae bacterium]|nr:hypothetical protein [Anaerolineae bacterium]
MKPEQTPFSKAWWSVELPGYRVCNGTYCFFPYEQIPPLDEDLFRGEFQWLTALDSRSRSIVDIHKQVPDDALALKMSELSTSARQLNLKLPTAFVKFMSVAHLRDQIPSCTACYFDLPEKIIEDPFGGTGYVIRFLNDQQDILIWSLYLKPGGDHCVLVSSAAFDELSLADIPREALLESVAFCAESFEAFLYRFWLENTLWFALSGGQPLTDEQKHYVSHYTTD